jgi:hypothetical protein
MMAQALLYLWRESFTKETIMKSKNNKFSKQIGLRLIAAIALFPVLQSEPVFAKTLVVENSEFDDGDEEIYEVQRKKVDKAIFSAGVQASQITGTGFYIRQYLEDNRHLQYTFFARSKMKDVEAGDEVVSSNDSIYSIGLSYRHQLYEAQPLNYTFDVYRAGWFMGGTYANEVNTNTPRKEEDLDTKYGALGGGMFVSTQVNKIELEASIGVHYAHQIEDLYIEEFAKRGTETERTFGPGFGISVGYNY